MKKKNLITLFGTFVLASLLIGSTELFAGDKFEGHVFPELGYAYNALEPYIDARTMEIHYDKHHRAYYTNFMNAVKTNSELDKPMPEVFASVSKHGDVVRNMGGGYYNHNLFWENLSPTKKEIPSSLKAAIDRDFGSVDAFKEKFGAAAKKQFGSGWAWLSVDKNGKLFVSSTANQDNPLMDVVAERGTPLLAIDVWEHAYYLLYQNRRAEYVDNFWNIVNWEVVEKRLKAALN